MLNVQYLDEAIRASGKKKEYLAEKCGISRAGFRLKSIGKNEFTAKEVKILTDELGLSEDLETREKIFFA